MLAHLAELERRVLEAVYVREAVLDLQRQRGRLSKVTVSDFLIVLAGVRELSLEQLQEIAKEAAKEAAEGTDDR